MSVRTKNLKAPLGFFSFCRQNKKRENGSPIQRSPEIFRKPKNILGSLQKNRSKLHGLLSRRNTASHRCSSLQSTGAPFCLPVSGCSFRMLSEIFIDILLFFQFFICSSTFSHCMSPLITQIPAAPVFLTDAAFFAADAADGINRNGYAFHNLLQKRQPSGASPFLQSVTKTCPAVI